LGEFVPAGAPLFEIAPAADRINVSAALISVELGLVFGRRPGIEEMLNTV
jgi:hypothetical protein